MFGITMIPISLWTQTTADSCQNIFQLLSELCHHRQVPRSGNLDLGLLREKVPAPQQQQRHY